MGLFERKRCKQCGWELRFFSKQKFCSAECVSIWEKNKRAQDEKEKKKTINELDKVREWRERNKYEELKQIFEDEQGLVLNREKLNELLSRMDENSKKYVEEIKQKRIE